MFKSHDTMCPALTQINSPLQQYTQPCPSSTTTLTHLSPFVKRFEKGHMDSKSQPIQPLGNRKCRNETKRVPSYKLQIDFRFGLD